MANTPNQKRRRAERTREFLDQLGERFPDCFPVQRDALRPLAVGVQEQLRAALAEDPAFEETPNWLIKQALARHTRSPAYLEAIIAGRNRLNLDGSDAGAVSDTAREHARASREEQKKVAAVRRREQGKANRRKAPEARAASPGKLTRLADTLDSRR